MIKIKEYNIRVYGILINTKGEILLSKESKGNHHFTKFPGGGHELGEGIIDCLKREFKEELDIEILVGDHLYTTDYFQLSAFDENQQLISIYYWVNSNASDFIKDGQSSTDPESDPQDHFLWRKLQDLNPEELTYPIDKKVCSMILEILNAKKGLLKS